MAHDSLSLNAGRYWPIGVLVSIPSSRAIAPAAAPCAGPSTKKLAPCSGFEAPGVVRSISGLDGSRLAG